MNVDRHYTIETRMFHYCCSRLFLRSDGRIIVSMSSHHSFFNCHQRRTLFLNIHLANLTHIFFVFFLFATIFLSPIKQIALIYYFLVWDGWVQETKLPLNLKETSKNRLFVCMPYVPDRRYTIHMICICTTTQYDTTSFETRL